MSISSLESYRRALVDFVRLIPDRLSGEQPHACELLKKSLIGALVIVVVAGVRDDLDRAAVLRPDRRQVQAVQGGPGTS